MHNQLLLAPTGFTDVLVRSRIAEILQPYLRYLEGWQLRASYLKAQFLRHPPGSDGFALAERRRRALEHEIKACRAGLEIETVRLPPDDRVDMALDELDVLLAALSDGRPNRS